MKKYNGLSVMLAALVLAALTTSLNATGESDFYKRPALFSTRPEAVNKFSQSVNRLGPVGIGIELTQPAFGMKVKNVEPGSPAAATGKIKAGQIIETINGQTLKDIDPRIQLGSIVTKAEATDGNVVLVVKDSKDATPQSVTVNIPILGAYSETWPLNCPKSDTIVRNLAARCKAQGHSGGIGLDGPMILFMLSTGEEEDLDVVRGWVKNIVENSGTYAGGSQWNVSWGAPPLAEYYLRTGDESVLPLLKEIADAVQSTQHSDGWSGRGGVGHHMGLAGTGTLTFLLLAKQCGVDVDETMLERAVLHYYRFAGRGTNPYMDYPPEGTYTDNGRNGRLAFAMEAASRLRPEGDKSLYARASEVSAMKCFYSTSYMLHGHTGGGIGEVWRSAAMGLMVDKRPHHYREFMKQRTWFYDLSRRYDGSFGVLGGGDRYDSESWGVTMGLTYTAPRKKLCIFGAPRSKYAKTDNAVPYRCWGSEASDEFLSIDPPRSPDGKVRNMDEETIANDTALPVNIKMDNPDVTDQEILKYIYHPESQIRDTAAGAISKHQRYHLIPELLRSEDARLRAAGLVACNASLFADGDAIAGFPRDEMRDLVFKVLNDPAEAWFVQYRALNLLKGFDATALAPHVDSIRKFLAHEEWWLRRSALDALVPLMADAKTYKIVLPAIEEHLPNFWRWSWDFSKRMALLQDANPEVQKAVAESLGRVYERYPGEKAMNPPGGISPTAHSEFLRGIAYTLDRIPGGLDVLFRVSRERYPNQTLPHSEQFLARTDLAEQNPELQKALQKVIGDVLIPEFVATHWSALKTFASAESEDYRPMSELQKLYDRAGVETYHWRNFGPEQTRMKWYYHSFDPPEEWVGVSDRLGRYRDVTFPAGMTNWFAADFDPEAVEWTQGFAPFGAADGKMEYPFPRPETCPYVSCQCGAPIQTLWEKDVLLLQGTFSLPPFEEGYCYRIVHGGIEGVGAGGGYRLYVNGKLFKEETQGVDRRAGGLPRGRVITKEWWPEFSGRDVNLAAITFKKHHPRTRKYGGNISIFLQRMKAPPLNAEALETHAAATPMLTSEWQELQDPDRTIDDPDEGKFAWDGSFVANPHLLGNWQAVDRVQSMEEFDPNQKTYSGKLPFSELTLKEDGKTHDATWGWTRDMLLDLTGNQALKMAVKVIDGTDYLFVEAGGFSDKHPVGWTCPLSVYKKEAE